jgi:hypothetical protein
MNGLALQVQEALQARSSLPKNLDQVTSGTSEDVKIAHRRARRSRGTEVLHRSGPAAD